MTNELEPRKSTSLDVVRDEELRAPTIGQYVHGDGTNEDGDEAHVTLLDPLVAYQREAARMQAAGPRRRVTADDIDRLTGGVK